MAGMQFVVLMLAAWRLAHLLVKESGPFDVFVRLRQRIGIQQIVVQQPDGRPDIAYAASNWLAEGLMCVWCVSVWSAAFFYLSTFIPHWCIVTGWLTYILALSAGAVLVQEFVALIRGGE